MVYNLLYLNRLFIGLLSWGVASNAVTAKKIQLLANHLRNLRTFELIDLTSLLLFYINLVQVVVILHIEHKRDRTKQGCQI